MEIVISKLKKLKTYLLPEIGFRPLSPSGLMGPVKIIPIKKVAISI